MKSLNEWTQWYRDYVKWVHFVDQRAIADAEDHRRRFLAFVAELKGILSGLAVDAEREDVDSTPVHEALPVLTAFVYGSAGLPDLEHRLDAVLAMAKRLELRQPKPKPSRAKGDSEVTKWVRKNWHKYGYNKAEAVRRYIDHQELSSKLYSSLYTQLNNDTRKNPLKKPENGL